VGGKGSKGVGLALLEEGVFAAARRFGDGEADGGEKRRVGCERGDYGSEANVEQRRVRGKRWGRRACCFLVAMRPARGSGEERR